MRKIIITASLLVLVTCNQLTSVIFAPQDSAKAEEYAVYSAVIQTLYIGSGRRELIVINDQTSPGAPLGDLNETLKYARQSLPGLTDEISADFAAKNQQPQPLEPLLNISVKYVFISAQELETIFKSANGWDVFYAKYPHSQGEMTLSRVGFNRQMDTALVYVGNQSHWLAGAGYYVLLGKADGKWTVRGQTMVWIS